MRSRFTAVTTALLHPLFCLAVAIGAYSALSPPAHAQGPVRIYGTNNAGQSVPIQVAADGSLKLTLNVSGYEFEGTTDDAFETTLAVVDPTADRTITFPDATGFVPVFANAGTTDVSLVFEGSTANDFETTVTVTDPTADRTITVPNLTGTLVALATVTVTDDGDGAITFLGASAGFDEDLTLNLDDVENTVTFTSSTGLVTANFSGIALQESGVTVLNADEIDASSELAAIIDDETGTGVVVFGTAPVFTTSATVGLIATQDVIKLLPVTDDDRFTATITVADLTGDASYTLPVVGGTFAMTVDKLSVFAATTSAEFVGVISDETGVGVVALAQAGSFPVVSQAALITETAAANALATYTASFTIPANSTILDFQVRSTAVWTDTGTVVMNCGDTADPDGVFAAVDLKTKPAATGEALTFEHPYAVAGADLTAEIRDFYRPSGTTAACVVTVENGDGAAGVTHVLITYAPATPAAVSYVNPA